MFKGFFKNFADSLFVPLTESLDDEIDDICYMAIYSDWDVEACLNYRTSGSNGIFNLLKHGKIVNKKIDKKIFLM